MTDAVAAAVSDVVKKDLCSGCGLCTLIDSRIDMRRTEDGFARPVVGSGPPLEPKKVRLSAARFRTVCPGLSVEAPTPEGSSRHPLFGPVVSAWEGWAADPHVRHVGSSGGVLTALARWLVESGEAAQTTGVGAKPARPSETVPTTNRTGEEVVESAGSRYGPCGALENPDVLRLDTVAVMKPCEASGLTRLLPTERPLVMSFFCAGVPSQHATDQLLTDLGLDTERLASMRYRGHGWPGQFTATQHDGATAGVSYDESWGHALGPKTQWRCKLCVDGVGESADIVAGDYWVADERGYPVFDESDGTSVVLARTQRGHDVLTRAREAGVVELTPVDVDKAAAIQPLQTERRITLLGRLLGVRLGGRAIPRYRGFALWRLAIGSPRRALRAAAGSFVRARGWRRR